MAKICPFPDLDDGRTELISRSSMYRVAVSASPLSLHFFTTKHHSSALLSRHHRLEQAILLSEHSADITAPSHRFMSHSLQQSNNTDFDTQQITDSTRLTSAQHDDYDTEDFPPITEELFSLETDEVHSAISTEDIGPSISKRKGKARQERNRNQAADEEYDSDSSEEVHLHSPIANLPLEILSRILAHLDPTTLLHCTAVSRTFAGVAKDDATWRLAFALAFHLEGTGTTPILRRVDAISWKAEYTRRIELLRRWRKARSPTVICDPRISTIHAIALSLPHHFLLSGSESFGVASRCDPFTGKVAKGYVDSSGQLNGLGVGGGQPHLAAEGGEEVTSMRLESDASRIVWGYSTGEIGMTLLARQGTNPRGAIKGIRFSPRGRHSGAVLDIAMPFGTGRGGAHSIERSPDKMRQKQAQLGEAAEVFATGGMDGTVRLWSPKKAIPIWTDTAQHSPVHQPGQVSKRPDPVVCVEMDVESGTVVAATAEGQVTIWTGIDIGGLVSLPASAYENSSAFQLTAALMQAASDLKKINQRIHRLHLPPLKVTGLEDASAPCILALDVDQSTALPRTFHARLLVFCSQGSAFERLTIAKEPGKDAAITSCVFVTPEKSPITTLRPDFNVVQPRGSSSRFAERRFVCAGTSEGKVIIWDWDCADQEQMEAWCTLDGHHTVITAIDVTAHVIVVGCSDGTIKAFDPLTGQHIRTFNDRTATRHPARMLAAGELTEEEASRFNVSQIIAGPDILVASIGGQVLAWKAEKLKSKTGRKSAAPRTSTGKSSVGRLWDPKLQSQKEMERDVFEAKEQLKKEQEDRRAEYDRIKHSVGGRSELEIGGLSEQEALEYAMMLSRDEQQVQKTGPDNDELQDALEQIAMAESSASADLPSHYVDESVETSTSMSPSPSPVSSPYLSGLSSPPSSRAWDILHQAGSSASPASRNQDKWHPNNKVNIVQVPYSARHSFSHSSASASRRPSTHLATPPILDSSRDWPSIEPSSLSRSPGQWQLGSPANQHPMSASSSRQSAAVSPTLTPSRSPIGAWAGGSPSLRPVKEVNGKLSGPRPSALTSSKPGIHSSSSHSDSLDDDIKFALELSIAEEQSRKAP